MTLFVGLDVSVKETAVCVVDDTGKVVCEQKVPTEPDDIVGLLASIGEDYGRIGIEAGPLSQWLVNGLTAAGLPVVCVETRHMMALSEGAADQQERPQRCARDCPDDAGRPVQAGACEDAGGSGATDAADEPQAPAEETARRRK